MGGLWGLCPPGAKAFLLVTDNRRSRLDSPFCVITQHRKFEFGHQHHRQSKKISNAQATIGGRFAPLATLVDEDDSMATHFNKAVTDTAAELLGKQRRKRKSWVTAEILDLCDQRRDLKKKRGGPEGAKDYRVIKRKIRTEMKMVKETWIQGQCQEVEACLRKNNSKKAYQVVKDLTTEKQGKSTTIQDKSRKCLRGEWNP